MNCCGPDSWDGEVGGSSNGGGRELPVVLDPAQRHRVDTEICHANAIYLHSCLLQSIPTPLYVGKGHFWAVDEGWQGLKGFMLTARIWRSGITGRDTILSCHLKICKDFVSLIYFQILLIRQAPIHWCDILYYPSIGKNLWAPSSPSFINYKMQKILHQPQGQLDQYLHISRTRWGSSRSHCPDLGSLLSLLLTFAHTHWILESNSLIYSTNVSWSSPVYQVLCWALGTRLGQRVKDTDSKGTLYSHISSEPTFFMNLLHIVLTMHGQKKNKILKNQMKFKKQVLILVLAQWM